MRKRSMLTLQKNHNCIVVQNEKIKTQIHIYEWFFGLWQLLARFSLLLNIIYLFSIKREHVDFFALKSAIINYD
jgi:hypothetical protein